MKQHRQTISLAMAAAVVFAGFVFGPAAPVLARGGDDGITVDTSDGDATASSSSSVKSTDSGQSVSSSGQAKMTPDDGSDDTGTVTGGQPVETETEKSHKVSELRDRAESSLKQKREDRGERTQRPTADKQKICATRKASIDRKFSNLNTHAAAHLDQLNKVFSDLQSYKTTNDLAVSGYDDLLAAADAKKLLATTAVSALSAVAPAIDCTVADPVTTIAGAQNGVSDAKQALSDYRHALKNLLQATRTAADSTTRKTEGQS